MSVSVHGAELFYSRQGKGPACLVPSAIGTRPYERQLPPPLTDRFELVCVDLRGGGRSTGDPADLTFDVLAEDLEAVRADLGVERVAVLGHSIIGVLALEYARRCPESVSHVIGAGLPPVGDMGAVAARASTFFEEDATEDRKRVLRDNLAALPSGASFRQAFHAQAPTRFFDPRVDMAPLFAGAEYKPALLTRIMGTLTPGWDVTVGSESLRVPILLAHGRYDYTVPYVLWDGVVGKLPDATLELFERSGHQPFYEEPERFASVVGNWMGRT